MQIVVANHAVEATQNIVVDASCSNSRAEGDRCQRDAGGRTCQRKTVAQREVPRCGRRALARTWPDEQRNPRGCDQPARCDAS